MRVVSTIWAAPLRRHSAAAIPHFADFMTSLAELLKEYGDDELRVIAGFSARAARIRQDAAGRLGAGDHTYS